jgi:hypothetical protein
MTSIATSVVLAVAATVALPLAGPVVRAADTPGDRVVVMYFHRTERCPTCKLMGSYSEEAVKSGFQQQVEAGTVRFYYVDFEDKKNERLVRGYKIEDPSLVVAKIAGKKVEKYANLEEIWDKVTDKPAFIKYVQDHVAAFRKRAGDDADTVNSEDIAE